MSPISILNTTSLLLDQPPCLIVYLSCHIDPGKSLQIANCVLQLLNCSQSPSFQIRLRQIPESGQIILHFFVYNIPLMSLSNQSSIVLGKEWVSCHFSNLRLVNGDLTNPVHWLVNLPTPHHTPTWLANWPWDSTSTIN